MLVVEGETVVDGSGNAVVDVGIDVVGVGTDDGLDDCRVDVDLRIFFDAVDDIDVDLILEAVVDVLVGIDVVAVDCVVLVLRVDDVALDEVDAAKVPSLGIYFSRVRRKAPFLRSALLELVETDLLGTPACCGGCPI